MPEEITLGPDGALWFTEQAGNKIGRITTSGTFTEFAIPTASAGAEGIVAGPDGNLWFTENSAGKIAKITTDGAGTITEYPITTANSQPVAVTVGAYGGVWFVEQAGNNIGKIDPLTGVITEYALPTANSQPLGIRPGSDGALWFTESGANKIGRITGTGAITEFANPDTAGSVRFIAPAPDGKLIFTEANVDEVEAIGTDTLFKGEAAPPTPAPGLGYIGLGPDAAVWFVEQKANKIARVSQSGFGDGATSFEEFAIPTASSNVVTLTAGPDGNLWFVEQGANKIGRFTLPPSTTPLVAAVLPGSRSVVSGATATAFATMINAGTTALSTCKILPLSATPVSLSFQTTNPATNATTGDPDTSVTLAAGGSQSFLLALTANTTFVPSNVILSFSCKGVDSAFPIIGLNTLLLSSSATQVPDVIALALTPSSDGVLDITGTTGSAAFAVATANVGGGDAITAFVDTGSSSIAATVTICETNPATGACYFTAHPVYGPVVISSTDTPTYSVFATATGAIPFSPATNRIFVRFKDSKGVVRGETSVAVRTQ
jgi:virginiamycin B lyase